MNINQSTIIHFLISSEEPWTRYRTYRDILKLDEASTEVQAARIAMLAHPQIQTLVEKASAWGDQQPLKRHNDANHPLYALLALADFGLIYTDEGIQPILEKIVAKQSPEGAFYSPLLIPQAFGGSGEVAWSWIACDTPLLIYILLAMGISIADDRVSRAVDHYLSLSNTGVYGCIAAPELGRFKGPGRRSDPCPMATLLALKVYSLLPSNQCQAQAECAAEMLLNFWQHRKEKKYFLFGMGSDFCKLKFPFIWFDIVHVMEVLSRFPFAASDPRFKEMLSLLQSQARTDGTYQAQSAYQAWKYWSFSDKKKPSPWLTFILYRIFNRVMH